MFSIVAGIYKKGLSINNREYFLSRLTPEINQSPGVMLDLFKGENFCAVGARFKPKYWPEDCPFEMGGNLLSVCDEQTSLTAGVSEVWRKKNGSWSVSVLNDHEGVVLGRDNAGAQTMYYYKRKGSFIFPKKYILASNNYEYLKNFLSLACIRKHGFVEVKPVIDVVDRYRRGDNSVEDRIWTLVLLQSWAELGAN